MSNEIMLVDVLPSISIDRGMVRIEHKNGRTLAVHPHDFLVFLKEGERVMAAFLAKQSESPAKIRRRPH